MAVGNFAFGGEFDRGTLYKNGCNTQKMKNILQDDNQHKHVVETCFVSHKEDMLKIFL